MAILKRRCPRDAAKQITEIVRLNNMPMKRYAIACELKKNNDISLKTALDYVLSASKEGVLVRAGFNYTLPKQG